MLRFFSKRIYIVVLIFLTFLIWGFYSLKKLPVDIFPDLNYPLFNVITHYEASSPEDIEILITKPIEQELFKLPYVRRVSSVSRQGFSQVTVEFDWGTSVTYANQLVLQAISSVRNRLSVRVKPVVENLGSSLQEIIGLGVILEGKDIPISELKYLVRTRVANRIRALKGVYRVEVIGGEDACFMINPKIEEMMRYHLTPAKLASIIKNNNYQIVIGYLQKGNKDYAIRGIGNITNETELKNIPVKTINGHPILLKDIAEIKKGNLPKRYQVYINGKPGIAVSVFKTKDSNTVDVAGRVKKLVKNIVKDFPYPISVVKYYDQSELINTAAGNLKGDILLGGILVIIMLFLFFGRLRDSLLISATIPLIAIITFIFFPLEHLSLNMITLGAMAVAVGMIIDDSIIVLENIIRHREGGESSTESVKNGVKEIFAADISGTLTTVAAFIPFIFLSGLAGRFTASFGAVMITILLVSLSISLTLIPLVMTRGKENFKNKKAVISPFFTGLEKLNRKIINKFLKHKTATIIGVILIFTISSLLLIFSPISFLPPIDEGAILLEYVLPPGTSLNESSRIAGILEKIALSDKDVVSVYRRTGSESGTYQVEPVNKGELVIKLRSKKIRKKHINKIINDLKNETNKIPGMITLFHQVTSEKIDESMSGLPTIFGLTIYGNDYRKLIRYSKEVESIAEKTPGIGSVLNLSKYSVPIYSIKPIPEMIGKYNLTSKDVMDNLKYYLTGGIVSNLIIKERSIPIYMNRYKETNDIKELLNLPITTGKSFVPLYQTVSVKESKSSNSITHINLQREVTLPMEIDDTPNVIIKRLNKKLRKTKIPRGFFIEFTGQYKLFFDMLSDVIIFSLISILFLYIIMGIQFGNYLHPLAIMFEIPFSFMGAFIALEITRQPMNISFFIGLITLLGVSVNNGIVLIDFINKLREKGLDKEEAIRQATSMRARPILLTTLTSLFALLPISFGIGIGAKIHQSLAIAVIGGLIISTFLTLNFLPVIYSLLDKRK